MKKYILLFTATIIVLAGCTTNDPTTNKQATNNPQTECCTNTSTNIAPGLDHKKIFFDQVESAFVSLYRINPKQYSFEILENSSSPQTISGWKESNASTDLIVNAAYFTEEYKPTGFLLSNGQTKSVSEYDYNKSGMVVLSPNPEIVDTAEDNAVIEQNTNNAFQSFPFLITDNTKAVSSDSGKTARRTFIGSDTEENIYIGIIPEYFVSLYQTADILLHTDIQWSNVINLDGGTSTGLYSPIENTNSYTSVPSVIAVSKK